MKNIVRILAALLMILGYFALNFTKFEGVEHHVEWANETGMPAPSTTIFYVGVACIVLGSMTFGRLLAKRPQ